MKVRILHKVAFKASAMLALAALFAFSSVGVVRAQTCVNPYGPADMAPVADINASGAINISDVACMILTTFWTLDPVGSPYPVCVTGHYLRSDLNCSGSVDVGDILLGVRAALVSNFRFLDLNQDGCPDQCSVCEGAANQSCLAGADCYGLGELNPDNGCLMCSAGGSFGAWDMQPDGVNCAADRQCYGGQCVALVPGAPIFEDALPVDGGVLLSFGPPIFEGTAPVTSYVGICESPIGNPRPTGVGVDSPVFVPLPSDGQVYRCAIQARNTHGSGPTSIAGPPVSGAPARATCAEHWLEGEGHNGRYLIDPAPGVVAPFPAYCDMVTDGGGWTLYSTGGWLYDTAADMVLDPAAVANRPLESTRATALVDASLGLFRITDLAQENAFFIKDPSPLLRSVLGGYNYGHMWASAADEVQCAVDYQDVLEDRMTSTATFEVTCDANAVGQSNCATGSGWLLFHVEGPYDYDGNHPCSLGPGQTMGLTTRWVR